MQKVIGFVTGGLTFNGNTIKESALGGSESAMIYMARELAKLGNEVYVFCQCDQPGIIDGVVYDSNQRFKDKQYPQLDVCVVSRYLEFFQAPIDSNLNIYWVHDIPYTKLFNQMWQVDDIFCMSQYQKDLYSKEKFVGELIHVTKNGYDVDLVDQTKCLSFNKRKHHYIYASRAERGLKLLLEKIWPRVVELDPLAQLHLCGYDNSLPQVEEMRPLYNSIEELKDSADNIVDHKFLTKKEYYKLLGKCGYMLYPSDFPEISCINAIEAQALGCLVISTDKYALTETVKTDTLVDSEYGSEAYVDKFIDILKEFSDPINHDIETTIGRNSIQGYAWSKIAEEWNNLFDLRFVQRMDKHRHQVINNLVYKSDIYAAWKLTGDKEYRLMLDCAKANNADYDIDENTAADIGRDPDNIPRIKSITSLLEKYVDKSKKHTVLDLGCFTGLVSTGILRHLGSYVDKYYAYDVSAQALALFKEHRHDPRIEYINDNLSNLQKHNLKADIVICGEILEHIEDTVDFLNALMTVASPGTIFVFTTPYGPWESIMLRKHPDRRDALFNHIHNFEFSDILSIFSDVQDSFFITRPYNSSFTSRGDRLDNWVYGFRYQKTPTFHAINYEEKALKTRPYFSIATCVIVKNEEINLARCLNSVKGISDQIIVIDTGSTDGTKEIAKKYTNEVYDFEWNDSFEDARNFSLTKTKCDWILYIDADEELFEATILGKLIESSLYDGIIIEQRQVCVTGDATKENQNPTRLFRNNGKIKFFGLIHELPGYSENEFVDKSLNQREAYIAHYGYMNKDTIMSVKLDRNHRSLLKDMEKYPNRWFGKTYYIRDMYFMFLRDLVQSGKPDFKYIDEMLSMWDTEFRNKKIDHFQWDFAKKFAFFFVQGLYEDMAKHNVGFNGKLPFMKTINFKQTPSVELWFRDQLEYEEFINESREEIDKDVLELFSVLSARYMDTQTEVDVPCGECNACCRSLDVYLTEKEVTSGTYMMEFMPKAAVLALKDRDLPSGSGVFKLARSNGGSCFYLREGKCSIYEKRPAACKQFDCRTCKEPSAEIKEALKMKFGK